MRLFLLMPFFILMCITPVKAHGDLDLRIQAFTSAIEASPDSAELYFQRGKLRFQHEEYKASLDDINISFTKGYYHELQNIYLAKSHYRLEAFETASQYLEKYLENDPKNVVGLNLKGRILFAQQRFESSALCFEQVIQLSIKSLPENYLEAVQSWNRSSHPEKYAKVVSVLELGLKNLGPIVTLQNKLLDNYLQNQNEDMAIALQLKIIANTKRKESAYFKLADIYLQLNENEKAQNALLNAKSEWQKLPLRIRKNLAMKKLIIEIEQLITKLN